jgi:hypothetical protein
MQKPPFTNQLNHTDQVLGLIFGGNDTEESPDATASEYEWAISKRPNDRLLHYNYGVFLLNMDRNAAIQQLRMSRPWDGFPVFSPDGSVFEQ